MEFEWFVPKRNCRPKGATNKEGVIKLLLYMCNLNTETALPDTRYQVPGTVLLYAIFTRLVTYRCKVCIIPSTSTKNSCSSSLLVLIADIRYRQNAINRPLLFT